MSIAKSRDTFILKEKKKKKKRGNGQGYHIEAHSIDFSVVDDLNFDLYNDMNA